MKELTKAEEQVMQILWKLKKAFVKDILKEMKEPKPAYNTVSTIIRILEKKKFVDHKAYGKTHEYFPVVTKKEYTKNYFKSFMGNYFNNSFKKMVSFFSKEEDLSVQELEKIKEWLEQEIENKKENSNE